MKYSMPFHDIIKEANIILYHEALCHHYCGILHCIVCECVCGLTQYSVIISIIPEGFARQCYIVRVIVDCTNLIFSISKSHRLLFVYEIQVSKCHTRMRHYTRSLPNNPNKAYTVNHYICHVMDNDIQFFAFHLKML